MTEPNLKDPRKLFYSDGFPQQDQETPALQDKMVPKPDCGEDSYVGNHKLENRRVLITGGDSGIGRAAAILLVKAQISPYIFSQVKKKTPKKWRTIYEKLAEKSFFCQQI